MGTKKTIEYNLKIGAQIEEVTSKTKKVGEEFNKLNKTASLGGVEKEFSKISKIMDSLTNKANKPMRTIGNFDSVADELQRASRESGELYDDIKKLQNLTTKQKISLISEETERKKLQSLQDALEGFENRMKAAQRKAEETKTKKNTQKDALKSEITENKTKIDTKTQERNTLKEQSAKVKAELDGLKKMQSAYQDYAKTRASYEKSRIKASENKKGDWDAKIQELEKNMSKEAKAWEKYLQDYDKYIQEKEQREQAINDPNRSDRSKKIQQTKLDKLTPVKSIEQLENEANVAEEAIKGLNSEIHKLENSSKSAESKIEKIDEELKHLGENDTKNAMNILKGSLQQLGISMDSLGTSTDEITTNLKELIVQGVVPVDQVLNALQSQVDGMDKSFDQMRETVVENKDAFVQENEAAAKIDGIKQRIKAYVGLQGAADFTRKALRDAMATIKELDATMTEMAVVTDLGVGDYWDQLPEYTKRASDLGVQINDVYKASTLFYQQGLKTNEVVGISNETLKMARIAGLDAEDATNKMTAALRGFNMELDETSAQRVSDVYSELAAITASDTKEIASAMTKTASIASNAGMEFETTAAFLSQIIETTRESAETAGTAMKTVIARFQELKKDPAEIGEVDGEVVDANKIETALRSVGVQLRDTSGQFRALDEVFLELSSKWDGLDTNTQRYIATIAAGSRQQSRFIAMMSDYGRTQELVTAANNSAGASNKQFEKTLESLDAKLNELKNAWNSFTMSIMNNEFIKFGVDALTGLLNVINGITDAFPGFLSGFAKLGVVFGGMKLASVAANSALGSIGETLGTKKKEDTEGTEGQKRDNKPWSKKRTGIRGTRITTLKAESAVLDELRLKEIALAKAQESGDLGAIMGAERELHKQRALVINTTALTEAQKKALIPKIQDAQISNDQIAILGEEGLARMANAYAADKEEDAIKLLNYAQTTENNLKKGGLPAFFTEIGLRAQGKLATDLERYSIKKKVAAKWEEVKATIAQNAAMISGIAVTIAFVAAVALLIVGIKAMVDAYDEAANKQQNLIKELEKTTAEFADIAQEAKQNLSEISNERDGLKELHKTFSTLTKGTDEWKESLVEINSKVLELTTKYPELAKYVTMTNGAMNISGAGWEAAMDAQQKQYQNAVESQIAAQIQRNNAQAQLDFNQRQTDAYNSSRNWQEFRESESGRNSVGMITAGIGGAAGATGALAGIAAGIKSGAVVGTFAGPIGTIVGALGGLIVGGLVGYAAGYGGTATASALDGTQEDLERKTTGGLTSEEYQRFAAAAAEQGLTSSSNKEDFEAVYQSLGFDSNNFDKVFEYTERLGRDFDELSTQAMQYQNAQRGYIESLSSTIAMGNEQIANSEFYSQIVNSTTDAFITAAENIQSKADEMIEDSQYVDKDGEATDELITKYSSVSGLTEDEIRKQIAEESLSARTMVTAVAENEESEKIAKGQEKMLDFLESLDKNEAKVAKGLLSNDKLLTESDLQRLADSIGVDVGGLSGLSEGQIRSLFQNAFGTSLEEAGFDFKTLQMALNTTMTSREQYSKQARLLNIDYSGLGQLSAGALEKIIGKVFEGGTQTLSGNNAQAVIDQMVALLPKDEEAREKFANVFGGIEDITDSNAIAGLSQEMYDLGLITRDQIDEFNLLEDELIELANATSKVDAAKLAEGFFDLADVQKEILSGGISRRMSAEEASNYMGLKAWEGKYIKVGEDFLFTGNFGELIREKEGKLKNGTTEDIMKKANNYNSLQFQKTKAEDTVVYGRLTTEDSHLKQLHEMKDSFNKEGYSYDFATEQARLETVLGDLKYDLNDPLVRKIHDLANSTVYNLEMLDISTTPNKELLLRDVIIKAFKAGYAEDIANFIPSMIGAVIPYNKPDNLISGTAYTTTGSSSKKFTGQEALDALASGELRINVGENTKWSLNEGSGQDYIGLVGFENLFEEFAREEEKETVRVLKGKERYDKMIEILERHTTEARALVFDELNSALSGSDLLNALSSVTDEQTILNFSLGKMDSLDENQKQALNETLNSTKELALQNQMVVNSAEATYFELSNVAKASQNLMKGVAIELHKTNPELESFFELLSSSAETLTESKRKTTEYNTVLVKLRDSLQVLTGSDVSIGFLLRNQGLIEDFSKGNEESFKLFQEKLGTSIASNMGFGDAIISSINKIYENSDTAQVYSIEEFAKSLNMAADSFDIKKLEELEKIFASMGLLLSWEINADGTINQIATMQNGMEQLFETMAEGVDSWENPYTWLDNLNEALDVTLRKLEKFDREFDKILNNPNLTSKDLITNVEGKIGSLNEEINYQHYKAMYAQSDIVKAFDDLAAKGWDQYLRYDSTTGQLTYDLEGIDKAGFSPDDGAEFERLVGIITESSDLIQDSFKTLEDIEDTVEEMEELGRKEKSDIFDKIYEALIQVVQNQIDELQNVNEAIQTAQNALLNKMQQQIDEERQARDNQKTERELQDKRSRLSYLMMDTTGGNNVEIANLQKEIAEEEETYQESLVDQALDDLQKSNEKAAEQRQKQIDIATAQLDIYSQSKEIWEKVEEIYAQTQAELKDGTLVQETAAGNLLVKAGLDNLNPLATIEFWNSLNESFKLSGLYDYLTGGEGEGPLDKIETAINDTVESLIASLKSEKVLGNEGLKFDLSGDEYSEFKYAGVSAREWFETMNDIKQLLGQSLVNSDLYKEYVNKAAEHAKTGDYTSVAKVYQEYLKKMKSLGIDLPDFGEEGYAQNYAQFKSAVGKAATSTSSNSSVSPSNGPVDENYKGNLDDDIEPTEQPGGGKGDGGQTEPRTFGSVWGKAGNSGTVEANDEIPLRVYSHYNETDLMSGNGDVWTTARISKILDEGSSNEIEKKYDLEHSVNSSDALGRVFYDNGNWYAYLAIKGIGDQWVKLDATDEMDWAAELQLTNTATRFKTGGLADFTGPAWLDGTPSKPEYILNAAQTARFFELVDVLGSLDGKTQPQETHGDNYFDISIHVDSIEEDYDVDQLAERIKEIIYEDATYRNVNAIHHIR